MPKISVNILTKNRAEFLKKALASVALQSFKDFEVVLVNDGSSDATQQVAENFKFQISNFKVLHHEKSVGITLSRQEALEASSGEYIAILDDDDEWIDNDKLAKQVDFLNSHPGYVLVGGGIKIELGSKNEELRMRSETDQQIRKTMLLRNNFFTSTVMFKKEAAVKAGGFIKNGEDLSEDYDLWLRMGKYGRMYNFQQPFVRYTQPSYNKDKFRAFISKQLRLIKEHKSSYPIYRFASLILKLRLIFNK